MPSSGPPSTSCRWLLLGIGLVALALIALQGASFRTDPASGATVASGA